MNNFLSFLVSLIVSFILSIIGLYILYKFWDKYVTPRTQQNPQNQTMIKGFFASVFMALWFGGFSSMRNFTKPDDVYESHYL